MVDGGTVTMICDSHSRSPSEIKKELVQDGWPARLVLKFYKRI